MAFQRAGTAGASFSHAGCIPVGLGVWPQLEGSFQGHVGVPKDDRGARLVLAGTTAMHGNDFCSPSLLLWIRADSQSSFPAYSPSIPRPHFPLSPKTERDQATFGGLPKKGVESGSQQLLPLDKAWGQASPSFTPWACGVNDPLHTDSPRLPRDSRDTPEHRKQRPGAGASSRQSMPSLQHI